MTLALRTIPEKRGRKLFVDSVYGVDGSAARQRDDKPYATFTAARAAHLRGDEITFRPGVHQAVWLGKSYSVACTAVTRATSILTVPATAHGFAVGDRVRIWMTNTADYLFEGESIVRTVPNANSFTCVHSGSDGTSTGGGIVLGATIINAHGAEIRNSTVGGEHILSDYQTDPEITAPAWLIVRGGTYTCQAGVANTECGATNGDGTYFDLDVDRLVMDDGAEAFTLGGAASVRLKCVEVVGRASYGIVVFNGARDLWLDVERFVCIGAGISIQGSLQRGVMRVGELNGYEGIDGAATDVLSLTACSIYGNSTIGITVNLGGEASQTIVANSIICTGGKGVVIADGDTSKRIILCPWIESTLNSAASGIAIDLSAVTDGSEVLTLGPGRIISHSAASVGIKGPASGSVVIRLLGDVWSNKPLGANITIVGSGTYNVIGDASPLAGKQPLDATLTALAALIIAANSLSIGSGADAFSQTSFAANTFPARASTGDLVAKTITDAALTVLDDATVAAMLATMGGAPLASPTFTGTVNTAALTAGGTLTVNTGNLVVNSSLQSNTNNSTANNTAFVIQSSGRTIANANAVSILATLNGAGGNTDVCLNLAPTMSQTSTAIAKILNVNPSGTFGSGAKYLAWMGVSSALKLHVLSTGELEIADAGIGIVLKSPGGTRYRITISDIGVVTATAA